jgi:hypothetical protein
MQQEKKLSEKESLLIIQQMIQAAKKEQKDDGWGWIIWGWQLFAASVLSFLNFQFKWFSLYIFWNIFGVITIVFFIYAAIRYFFFNSKKKVKTYTGDLLEKLNIGFFIFLFLIILSINLGVGPIKGFALLMGLYGFWVLVYGSALNFRPSIVGAYLTMGFAIAALFVKTFDWIMVLHAFAVLCGYIIPGHLANIEFNKSLKKENTDTVV